MNNNTNKITDLKSLRLARAQLKAKSLKSELEIQANLAALKDGLFSSGSISHGKNGGLDISSKELSRLISSFVIGKWIKPKSKLVEKASIFFSSLLLQKYSSKITNAISKLISTTDQAKINE
ncbi:MAG: hypothetical protein RJQ00_06600 [Vicingaceae bacterium]